MYKAMIVEDEMLVRIGIRNVIKWDALGITLTEDAENGAQALELYRSERPDIILTDLRMPEMDGMSLIRNIRRQDKRCRFLILTCVEDFEQAQEAIAYSVSGYLLKLTMDFKEVEKMLQKAVDELSVLPARRPFLCRYAQSV
ncbi:MAG: response regulator [Eisenbergiella massiliensis]